MKDNEGQGIGSASSHRSRPSVLFCTAAGTRFTFNLPGSNINSNVRTKTERGPAAKTTAIILAPNELAAVRPIVRTAVPIVADTAIMIMFNDLWLIYFVSLVFRQMS
jgi:hypothetical protein